MVGQLHEQGNAGAAVIGAGEWLGPSARIWLLVGNWPRIVVRAKDHAALAVRIPGRDQVGHFDRLLLAELAGREGLELDLCATSFEMFLHEVLLPLHAVCAADSRADLADCLQVTHGSLLVEGDRGTVRGKSVA